MTEDDIGLRIKSSRKNAGMTQEELGKKVGVTKATINKYETGVVLNMKRPTIEHIAEALGVEPGYLMGWTDNATTVQTNNGVIGQNSGLVTVNNSERALSKEELELLRIYGALDVKRRMKLLQTAIELEEEQY